MLSAQRSRLKLKRSTLKTYDSSELLRDAMQRWLPSNVQELRLASSFFRSMQAAWSIVTGEF